VSRVEAELDGLPLEVVFNRDWAQGMGASINAGARLAAGAGWRW
jgi:CTP:molybdopterin cytidylyltransferase MocA